MSKEMVISATPHETRVAILEEGQLCEIYVEREKEFALVGSIYKGRVTRVLPGMQSSFVDIGLDSDAFLYVSDFLEEAEDLDHVVTTVEEKEHKMEEQGGHVFTTDSAGHTATLEPTDVEPAAPVDEAAAASAPTPAPAVLPGETITPGLVNSNSGGYSGPRDSRPTSRPPYENRGRDHRGYGRGGRRGRHDRRPGRGGGQRRFGGDLPHSKYASHRPYDPPTEVESGAPASDFVPVVLPGESLSKFKDMPAGPPSGMPPMAAHTEPTPAIAPEGYSHEANESLVQDQSRPVSSYHTEKRSEHFTDGWLAPLPGETLAHLRAPETGETIAAEGPNTEVVGSGETVETGHAQQLDRFAGQAIEETVREQSSASREATESFNGQELSEEEAVSLAEQVAEAQLEESVRAERDQQDEENGAPFEATPAEEENHFDSPGEEMEFGLVEGGAALDGQVEQEASDVGEEETSSEASDSLAAEAATGEGNVGNVSQERSARVHGDFRARMPNPMRRGRDRGRDRGRRDDRGRRPQRGHGGGHRPQQARRPQLISDLLKQGQEIIVQIAKEPLGKKGARITSHVALPGRYLVYMPTIDHTGVSRKIESAEERSRLRHLVTEAKGPFGGGFIVRTAASQASPEEVRADVEFLTRTWAEIKSRADQRKAPSLLHRDLNLVERILRDYLSADYTAIWVDSEEEYTKVVDFVSRFQPSLVNRVKLYTKSTPVYEEFGIQQEIDKGLRPKVWLKSGGYIVINHTEALVAIDVNTGKFVGKGSTRLEDTIVRTNIEAAKEVVRQMRLRDLGGIIVIDFIDMEERRNREKVMAALEEALKADRAPSKVLRFNEFGLVAITRKRTKQALERTLCQPCPYCTGSGMVKSIPTLCYEIQAEARKMAPEIESGSLTLRVHPEISKALKTRESSLMEELEGWIKKSVIIQADPTLHWEQYDIY